ncbi:MAG: hypothetical protein H6729_13905 [Deltaproteobacteria bacterium]|nr:hypothetical protein [Deltaproteobacteria bacterium]
MNDRRSLGSAAYRRLSNIARSSASRLRIAHLERQYPRVRIDRSSYVGPGCHIAASDQSEIQIENSYIAAGVVIRASGGGRIHLRSSYIGYNSVIAGHAQIEIDEGCLIAEMVVVRDSDHVVEDALGLAQAGHRADAVHIGRNVWIGAKATILRGVSIGDGAVVAASAVVRTDIEGGSLFAGIPARFIKRVRASDRGDACAELRGRVDPLG